MDSEYREPSVLAGLKTHPGGHRHLRRFDPRVKVLWRLLADHADKCIFTLDLNVSQTAAILGVARSTVQRWLAFLEQHKLIRILQHGGGRGRGIRVEMVWLKRGQELAQRRQRALAYKREQQRNSAETVAQRQTTFVSKESSTRECPYPDDSVTSGQLLRRVRQHTSKAMYNQLGAKAIQDLFGRAMFRDGVPPEELEAVVMCLEFRKHIHVPRWAKTPAAIYRWARATLRALWAQMAGWWRRLDRLWERAERRRDNEHRSARQPHLAVDQWHKQDEAFARCCEESDITLKQQRVGQA